MKGIGTDLDIGSFVLVGTANLELLHDEVLQSAVGGLWFITLLREVVEDLLFGCVVLISVIVSTLLSNSDETLAELVVVSDEEVEHESDLVVG